MIITKKALPRRTFLRGLSATLALPLLDAMVPALSALGKTAANPVCRLGFLYIPNGVAMNDVTNKWRPKGEGTSFEFSPILTPLAPFRDQLVIVSGLGQRQAEAMGDGNGDHPRASATWLNGARPKKTEAADIRTGTTADQLAAAQFGKETALPSLELVASELDAVLGGSCSGGYSCVYLNTLSWSSPTTPLPMENDPRVVFERLFGDGGTAEQRVDRIRESRSILDWVTEDLARLQRTLGPGDRTRVGEYLDTVREIERRIQKAEEHSSGASMPALERPSGIPTRFDEHLKLLFDLQVLAYQADLTRVCTLMYGREFGNRTHPEIGISEPHHGLSHHGDKPEPFEKFAKLNTYHTQLFAYFLEKLRSTPDGDGSLLDHMMLLYGGGLGNGNEHRHTDLPLVLAGGGTGRLKGGRHLVYPLGDATPMTNLLVTMLDKAGVAVERLGDSTGRLEPLSGL
jgi:hypothetical protein